MSTRLPVLSFRIRADLYAQLAAMEKAGLPVDKAFSLLNVPASMQTRLTKARTFLRRGSELSVAGLRSGLFTELEATLIGAATSAGSPAATYRRLADYYSQRAGQARSIKSRLMLPAFVLIVSLFVQPLPALFTGTLGFGKYLLHVMQPLAALAAIAYIVMALPGRINRDPYTPTTAWIEKAICALPLFGKIYIRRNIRDFFESLALMLEAGLPILDALPKALAAITDRAIRSDFARIRPKIADGATLTQALADVFWLEDNQSIALIHTGEESGALPEMLFRYAAIETETINNFYREAAAWLPRIVYALIAVWIGYGILSGAGIGPRL
jgi:general secretion pathway protein F